MGRRAKQLDMTLNQAEEFLYLANRTLDTERQLRMLRTLVGQDWIKDSERDTVAVMLSQTTEKYIEEVEELRETVMTVVRNPLFWSSQIPLPFRSGFAVLLNSPLKTEADRGD